jgi:hypothetical protein
MHNILNPPNYMLGVNTGGTKKQQLVDWELKSSLKLSDN